MSMDLTEQETEWAHAIKEALASKDSELANKITDFEYAHHAIIAKEKVDRALKRIQRLDTFRQEHDIPPATEIHAEDALQMIQRFSAICPGIYMAFGKHSTINSTSTEGDGDAKEESHYVSTWDYSAFLPVNIATPEDWKTCVASFYYLLDACHPDITAMRNGLVMLTEAQGLGWKNFSLEMEKRAAHLYQDAYPVRYQAMIMLHPPKIFEAMYALVKPFLNKKIKDCIQLSGNLEQVQAKFTKEVLPTTMGGTQTQEDMEQAMLEALKTRYANMASFKLPEKGHKGPAPLVPTTNEYEDEVET
ncbi:tocopherol transfer protein-like [Seminavis robusta]|uniref:Tocopherol transfer protein-like n=1 Tax=Seminavis robusta TaxID=568900 RepID=A0A9N8ED81_9STRA|nr:tocopherol transfer protein-like [Seminavis robusta]|eukprot:Sro773_g200510.1 tocopherol transfer protein-like (304) ;mRNA; f:35935-37008